LKQVVSDSKMISMMMQNAAYNRVTNQGK